MSRDEWDDMLNEYYFNYYSDFLKDDTAVSKLCMLLSSLMGNGIL